MADSIEYEKVREDIVEYLKKQEQFKDYNYIAPAISTLVDALAYVTSYLSTYANFSINEVFLRTAQKRSSITSKAYNLGYVPHQYTGAYAKLHLIYTGPISDEDNPDVPNIGNYVIPAGTTFTSTNKNITYRFKTKENFLIQQNALGYYYSDIIIHEGQEHTDTFTQNEYETVRFILSNKQIDTDTLKVTVYQDSEDKVGREFYKLSDIIQLTNRTNAVYSIEENINEDIELTFGDGITSIKIESGNIVVVSYDVVSGYEANNLRNFVFEAFPQDSDIAKNFFQYNQIATDVFNIEVIDVSSNGADRETSEEIRKNAPLSYQRQYRDVTADDYKADILNKFGGYLGGINVWGGENNIPPMYGYCIICAKPKIGNKLPQAYKDAIIDHVKKTNVLCITPVIVDPTVVYVDFNIDITYDKQMSGLSEKYIMNSITSVMQDFFVKNSSSFDCSFNYSKFLNEAFKVSEYIKDIMVEAHLSRYLRVNKQNKTYSMECRIPIEKGTLVIGPYYDAIVQAEVTIEDNNGILEKRSDGLKIETIGNVNYDTGELNLNVISFTQNEDLQVRYKPQHIVFSVTRTDVLSLRNVFTNATGV